MTKKHTSEISVKVTLDENKIPETLHWSAEDGGVENMESKAILMSVWDHAKKESLRIDLWTKEMPLDEMKIFFHQTLTAMSDTFERATNDTKMSATMRDFCDYFAEKLEIKREK
jgi:gliding motility-associated protein GldC